MMIKSSDRTAVHAGHLYVNGCHWTFLCDKCRAQMEELNLEQSTITAQAQADV